ncbi:MAG: tetratricopeptide repeat protein [Gemmataceae bacterium]
MGVGVLVVGAMFAGGGASEESVAGNEPALRKQALALNDVTGADPMSGALKKLGGDAKAAKQLLAVAAKMAKESPQPFNRNATLLLGIVAENAKEVDTSAAFYRLHAKQSLALLSERGLTQAYGRLIDLYLKHKRYTEGEKACKEFLALEGEEDEAVERLKPMVMRQLVLVVAKQGATDRALKMVEEMVKADPRNWLYRALKAQVLHEAEQYDEAAKVYLDVIERVERDGRLEKDDKQEFLDDYRYALSNLYIEVGNVEKAAEQLKILLARKPNNPTYNNDLGYIWADKGLNLAEAEKHIRRAIEEERKLRKEENIKEDNAAYLDSLGWVLFKQGKAKEAKPHLLSAVKSSEGQSIEIYDHLADVHLALGEKDEAIAVMKKGLEVAGTSKREVKRKAEVEKKLKMHEGK